MSPLDTLVSPSLDRRSFLARAAALASAASLGFAKDTPSEFVEVKTTHGRIRGQRKGNLITFRGVPYAGSPTGASGR
jgi:para-nitrobenzyl esterase